MKKIVALFVLFTLLAIWLCTPTAMAIGIAGYSYHYTNGRASGSFSVTATPNLSLNQITVETRGFDSDASITLVVTASDGVNMLPNGTLLIKGNQSLNNQPLRLPLTSQTYTITYYVASSSGDDGEFLVWLY